MFDTIIWATDGSELADSTLPVVTELAQTYGSRIVAVHAVELFRGGRFGGPLMADEDEIRAKISAQITDLRHAGYETADIKIEESSRRGAAELIADATRQFEGDLIVVASHGHGALASAVLGDVPKDLLRLAPCPVLVVPPLHARARHVEPRQVVTV